MSPVVAPPRPVNVAFELSQQAAERPDALAIAVPQGRGADGKLRYRRITYGELDAESTRLAHGLRGIGIGLGCRTVLMVPPSFELFALTFALLKCGGVMVMVDPGMGIKNLKGCLAQARPEAFIGIPKAHVARKILGWAKGTLRTNVTVGRRWFWGGYTLDQVRAQGDAQRLQLPFISGAEHAAILFTSGSTGPPKGAVYLHATFVNQVKLLKQMYRFEPGEIDLPTFPLFALFDPALGMATVLPEMDFTRPAQVDPKNIFDAVEQFGVTNMFGSPALLNTVARHGGGTVELPTLRRVISAGAPAVPAVLEQFASMLPEHGEIHTPYGATECLPVATIGHKEVLAETAAKTASGAGVCVGRPVESVNVEIITISDDPIEEWSDELLAAPGEIGEIVVHSPCTTHEYFELPGATALAKIPATADATIRHRMGDLGYVDEQGRLWMCGRKSHRVQTASGTLFTVPCEAVFNEHPLVFRTALVGLGGAPSQEPVLCVELEAGTVADEAGLRAQLRELGAKHDHTSSIERILFHPGFPVDIRHNAKIFREKLAVWAAQQLGAG